MHSHHLNVDFLNMIIIRKDQITHYWIITYVLIFLLRIIVLHIFVLLVLDHVYF
jgi:hypothetical protein